MNALLILFLAFFAYRGLQISAATSIQGQVISPLHNQEVTVLLNNKIKVDVEKLQFSLNAPSGTHKLTAESKDMIFNTLEIVIAPKNDKVECFEIIGNLKISSPIVLMGKPRNQISLSLKDQIFKDKSLTFLFLIFSLTFVLKKCNEHALSDSISETNFRKNELFAKIDEAYAKSLNEN